MVAESKEIITFTFRVEFLEKGSSGEHPFRIFSVPENYTLEQLAKTILELFDREFSHSYGFYDNIQNWSESKESYELFADLDDEEDTGSKSVKSTQLKDSFVSGKQLLFLYDYGEEWTYLVEMVDMDTAPEYSSFPIMEDAFGKVPGAMSETKSTLIPENEDEINSYYDLEKLALKRVAQIFGVGDESELPKINNNSLETFYDYLRKQVNYPFYGVFQEVAGENSEFHNVTVFDLIDPDLIDESEKYGLICDVELKGERVKMPLAEIVINQGDPNYDLIEDYCIWFWNIRNQEQ